MKKIIFSILSACICLSVFSQNSVSGKVVDSQTGLPIAYATVWVDGKSAGTIADQAGQFKLNLPSGVDRHTDSLIVSHMSYYPKAYSLSGLSEIEALLNQRNIDIEPIVITAKTRKDIKLGKKHTGAAMLQTSFFSYYEIGKTDRLGREMGMIFSTENDCQIKSLNFYLARNAYKKLKFRVSFYSLTDGLPDKIIINKEMIFDVVDKRRGWVSFDLDPYDIYIQKMGSFAVTLTLLDDELEEPNNWLVIPAAWTPNNGVVSRDRVMGDWGKRKGSIAMYLDVTSFID